MNKIPEGYRKTESGHIYRVKDKTLPAGIPGMAQYNLLGHLGRGTWSEVLLGERRTDSSLWALKFLRPNAPANEQMASRGWDTGTVWKKLSLRGHVPHHESIADCFIDTADNGENVLAERYINRFLFERMQEGECPKSAEISSIALGIATAMDVYHKSAGGNQGSAHGDITPRNLGYTLEGRVILSDNGLSTQGATTLGDFGSELVKAIENFVPDAKPTKLSDVSSFGHILFRLFTGKYMFEEERENLGEGFGKHMAKLGSDKKAWMQALDGRLSSAKAAYRTGAFRGIPWYYKRLIRNCLTLPENRIQDGRELLRRTEEAFQIHERIHDGTYVNRFLAALLLASLLADIFISGCNSMSENVRIKLQQSIERKEQAYHRKARYFVQYEKDVHLNYNDACEWMNLSEVRQWFSVLGKEGITDRRLVLAAYLNPEAVYAGLRANPRKTDYASLKPYLLLQDSPLVEAVEEIDRHTADNSTSMLLAEDRKRIQRKWDKVKADYEREIDLSRLYETKASEIEDKYKNYQGQTPAGMGMKAIELEELRQSIVRMRSNGLPNPSLSR